MDTVRFAPEFVFAATKLEVDKAGKSSAELERLMNIGYLNSQMALDVAIDVKTHLTKAYELLNLVDILEAKAQQVAIAAAIVRQSVIIKNIEMSL